MVARGGPIREANQDAEGALQGEGRPKAVRINQPPTRGFSVASWFA
jgi:hypothetical protein